MKIRTQSSAPSVNVTTGGGDVRVARAEGDTNPILAKVNLTVTEGLLEGQTLFVRGAFASLTHKGAGDVIMESADTSVSNLIKLGTGDVKEFGETGSVTTPDGAQECLLSLVPVSHDSLEVYLLSAKGLPLTKGSWTRRSGHGRRLCSGGRHRCRRRSFREAGHRGGWKPQRQASWKSPCPEPTPLGRKRA